MAVYINALHARNPHEPENSFDRSRNISASNATFFTSTTTHSQPTEPLLPTSTPQTASYDDQLDHIPRNRNEAMRCLPCEEPLMTDVNPVNVATERKGYWPRNCRRPLKWKQWLRVVLQASLAAWAIYNTVRYFIAFTDFGDSTNQAFCLALGTSTGVSFLLAFISFLVAIRLSKGLARGVTPAYLSYVRLTLDYLSSFCLLGPAVVNFVQVFIWKNSINPHLNLHNRCHLDIDVIWSASNVLCNNKFSHEWGIWLTVSGFRLALTLIVSIRYLSMSSLYHGPRRRRAIRGFRARTSEPSIPEGAIPVSLNLPVSRDLSMLNRLSGSPLCGTARAEPLPQNQIRRPRSDSSDLSQDISTPKPITLGRSTRVEPDKEHDPNEFVDRFQLRVSQIARETDEALDLAHSDHSPSPENVNTIPIRDLPPSYEDDFDETHVGRSHNNDDMFNLPPIFPALGYNEFGLPYPPDQNIRMLNGYIRRMPTIESMGSGEVGSSTGASSNRAGESMFTSSRPPTRNTLLSWNSSSHDAPGSEPPSRANSLSVRAELLGGLSSVASTTSEHGERLGRTSPVARRLSSPISYVDHAHGDSYSSEMSGSYQTSYHTATSKSFPPPGLALDTQLHTPVGQQDISDESEQAFQDANESPSS